MLHLMKSAKSATATRWLVILAIFAALVGQAFQPAAPTHASIPPAVEQTMTVQRAMREIGVFELVAFNAQGEEIWRDTAVNNLADEGEFMFLDVTLRNGTAATNFYLALYNDTPTETDTMATLTGEPSTNNYSRQLIERSATGWPTLALDSGDEMATSSVETFSASGGSWGPVTYVCLVTTISGTAGKLVSYAALSQSRTLASGESLQVTYKVKLQ